MSKIAPCLWFDGEAEEAANFYVSLLPDCVDQDEVDGLWDGLSAGGAIEQCGWLKDRYGVSWQVTPRVVIEMLADPDIIKAQRVMAAVMGMVKIDIAAAHRAYAGG